MTDCFEQSRTTGAEVLLLTLSFQLAFSLICRLSRFQLSQGTFCQGSLPGTNLYSHAFYDTKPRRIWALYYFAGEIPSKEHGLLLFTQELLFIFNNNKQFCLSVVIVKSKYTSTIRK